MLNLKHSVSHIISPPSHSLFSLLMISPAWAPFPLTVFMEKWQQLTHLSCLPWSQRMQGKAFLPASGLTPPSTPDFGLLSPCPSSLHSLKFRLSECCFPSAFSTCPPGLCLSLGSSLAFYFFSSISNTLTKFLLSRSLLFLVTFTYSRHDQDTLK